MNNETNKTKKIAVFSEKRLSLQRHRRRSERWYIITLDDNTHVLIQRQSVDIPRGALHGIANPGSENLHFLEIKTGDCFGGDDMERFEDDFGRV